MTRCLILALACFAAVALGDDLGTQVPEIPFDSVPNFLKLPPNLYLGEASGVAVNSKKHIFVFSRGNTTGPAYARHRRADSGVRSGRKIHPRDRPQSVRLVLRARHPRR